MLVEIIESSLCTTEDTNTIINMNDLMPSQIVFSNYIHQTKSGNKTTQKYVKTISSLNKTVIYLHFL